MDLLSTIRKEGSRGGQADFKWTDVAQDAHRENYLGHSLMAPVGRWQRGKDLSWYAKSGSKGPNGEEQTEEDSRKLELEQLKQAENEAIAMALGQPLPSAQATQPVATHGEVQEVRRDPGRAEEGDHRLKRAEYGSGRRQRDHRRHERPQERLHRRHEEEAYSYRDRSREKIRRSHDHHTSEKRRGHHSKRSRSPHRFERDRNASPRRVRQEDRWKNSEERDPGPSKPHRRYRPRSTSRDRALREDWKQRDRGHHRRSPHDRDRRGSFKERV